MKRSLLHMLLILAAAALVTSAVAQREARRGGQAAPPEREFAPPPFPRMPSVPQIPRMDRPFPPQRSERVLGPPTARAEKPGDDILPFDGELRRAASALQPFWRNDRIRKQGELTDEQVGKLDKNFNETRTKLIDLAAQMAHKRIALEEANRSDDADLKAIHKAIEELGKTRIELEKAMASYRHEIHQTLTPEQREQLKEHQKRMAERRAEGPARERLEGAMERLRNLPLEQREALRERMRNAPPEEREILRERLRNLPREEREEIRQRFQERRTRPEEGAPREKGKAPGRNSSPGEAED